jgi:cytochrome c-type biogenesis protein CcmE
MNRRVVILIFDIVVGVVIATALLFAARGCQTPLSALTPSQALSASTPVDRPLTVTGLTSQVRVSGRDRVTLVLSDQSAAPAAATRLAVIYVGPTPKPITDGITATFYGSLNSDRVLHADKYTLK